MPPAWNLSGIQILLLFGVPPLLFVYMAVRRVYGGSPAAAAARALLATAGLWMSMLSVEYVMFFTTLLALRLGA